MLPLVFDLDECLVATREANRAAYAAVGVSSPPVSDHMPARFWMYDKTLYERKHAVFPEHLARLGRALPTLELLRPGSTILTGTSARSVAAIRDWWPPLREYEILSGMGPEDKIRWLSEQSRAGIYFDDWSDFVWRVRRRTRWQAVDVSRF